MSIQLNGFVKKTDDDLRNLEQRQRKSAEMQLKLEDLLAQITKASEDLSADSLVLHKVLSAVKLDVENSVQKLSIATSNIKSNSTDFNENVSTLDTSNRKLNSLLDNINYIYRELGNINQRQIALVNDFQNIVSSISKSFEQIKNDSSNALEGVKSLKDNVKEIESLNIGTKKPNEKEQE